MNIKHMVSDSTLCGFHLTKINRRYQILLKQNPPTNLHIFKNKEFKPLRSYSRWHNYGNNKRKYAVYGVEPGSSPSGPPLNVLSWIVTAAIAIVVPLINYKWGPLLKKKVEAAMQITEDVAEAVEKAAEVVEKVAEDIADELPVGGELRKAVDFVEKIAERTAKDAGAIDEFIDKVQEEEEKAELFVESLKEESKKPPKDSNEVKPNDEN